MKSKALLTLIIFLLSFMAYSQEKPKTKTIEFQTNAHCNSCKEKIEHELAYTKGVKEVSLDMDTKIVKIVYKTSKTDKKKLRGAITGIGFEAKDIKTEKKAQKAKEETPPQ